MNPRALPLIGSLLALPASPAAAQATHVEGEALVLFRQNTGIAQAEAALNEHSLRLMRSYARIARQRNRVAALVRNQKLSTAELIATLQADPNVEIAEPNYLRQTTVILPDDAGFPQLWGLQNTGQVVNSTAGSNGVDIQFPSAWNLARPSTAEIVIGVVDTGMDLTHPDLAPNVWINPGEIPGNGIDDDNNGFTDDVHGFDFSLNTATIADSGAHGTHVAGTIAAVGRNGLGVIGVQYRAKLLPLKASTDGTNLPLSDILGAFDYAIALKERGVNIVAINASFGSASFSVIEQMGVAALRDAEIILCAAAGNTAADTDASGHYPASFSTSNIIAVAALTQNNALASFSNFGAITVDLAAPGENIYSTRPTTEPGATVANVSAGSDFHDAQQIQYSGSTSASGVTGSIHHCGIGNSEEFPAEVAGNIALIERGTLTFAVKVTNAMNAGAVAAIIYDNTTDPLSTDMWTLMNPSSWIPALRITQAAGQTILAALPTTGTVVNAQDLALAFQFLDGTSMATPHVSGAVAFAALNFPSETMSERIARVLNHTTPVADLLGKTVTGGRLDLLNIVDTDGDGLPDWWENEQFGNLGEIASTDGDGDSFSELAEFLAGTDPNDSSNHLAFSSAIAASDSSGRHFMLAFPSVEDRIYQIEWSPNLEAGDWLPLGAEIIGTGSPIFVEDRNALDSADRRFYRIGLRIE